MAEYYYWNPDEHDLDVPMISPHLIPENYIQHWNVEKKRWELSHRRGGHADWGKLNES